MVIKAAQLIYTKKTTNIMQCLALLYCLLVLDLFSIHHIIIIMKELGFKSMFNISVCEIIGTLLQLTSILWYLKY